MRKEVTWTFSLPSIFYLFPRVECQTKRTFQIAKRLTTCSWKCCWEARFKDKIKIWGVIYLALRTTSKKGLKLGKVTSLRRGPSVADAKDLDYVLANLATEGLPLRQAFYYPFWVSFCTASFMSKFQTSFEIRFFSAAAAAAIESTIFKKEQYDLLWQSEKKNPKFRGKKSYFWR